MDNRITLLGPTQKQTLVDGTAISFEVERPYSSVIILSDRDLHVTTSGGDAEDTDFYWLAGAYLTLGLGEGESVSVLVAADQDSDGVVRFTQAMVG